MTTPEPTIPLTFVPIPLATGDTTDHPQDRTPARIAGIRVTITLGDGTEIERPLVQRDTGWWIA